ncbi:hypothetical protein BD779DRAFT_1613997 [Infundibulicybe gibba]|nr:hypothetical protein BD779DRAFT_1613997 [Infundibulicybe gibba]
MSTGLFYVYVKNLRDDITARYLITFATRDVADRWWRALSQSIATGTSKYRSIQRISPQFYIHDPIVGNISGTIRDDPHAKEFLGSVDGRIQSICPVINVTERTNGSSFFIRSALRPEQFWYWNQRKSRVTLSTTRQTKFTISVVGQEQLRSLIMIGEDKIVISVAGETSIGADLNGWLTQTSTEHQFEFSDFSDGFAAEVVGDGESTVRLARSSFGEQWELV